jgi:hypothetical protein
MSEQRCLGVCVAYMPKSIVVGVLHICALYHVDEVSVVHFWTTRTSYFANTWYVARSDALYYS